jgi:ABC-type ATPase with predicted acetyltransferase domain
MTSTRAAMVARWFGVAGVVHDGERTVTAAAADGPRVRLAGGRVVLITGPSGAGKSTLLRRLRQRSARAATWFDLRPTLPTRGYVIDHMTEAMGGGVDEASVVAALEALSRVGLGEVWTYLRTPAQLSEGQRWRLRLALTLAEARPARDRKLSVLAADEFAAPLDRVTALVVARALRRAVDGRPDLCAVVATSHDDLAAALAPDVVVRCDFGDHIIEEGGSRGTK